MNARLSGPASTLPAIFALFLLASEAGAQPARHPEIEEELHALTRALYEAWQQRDRTALERLYADEFVFIHAFGYIDDRTTQIDEMLDAEAVPPLRLPSFEPPATLHVYGDVAVHRFPFKSARDTPGWNTTIYVRENGAWQIAQRQGTELVPVQTAIAVDLGLLGAYGGRYEREDGVVTTITLEGGALVAAHPGFPKRKLTPVSEALFFDKLGTAWTFHRDVAGRVTHVVIRFRDGTERRSERLD